MPPRIAPAQGPFPEAVQQALDRLTPQGVQPLCLFRVLARDPRLFLRFVSAGLLDKGNLTLRERELTILRVCANHRSEYEWGVHVAVFAGKAGFDERQRWATVFGAPEEACWSPRERLILRLCDALSESTRVGPDLWLELGAELAEEALLELLLLCGNYRNVSTLTNTLELPPEPWAPRFPEPPRPV